MKGLAHIKRTYLFLAAIIVFILLLTPLWQENEILHDKTNMFVTRSGSSLFLNSKPFRFSGANIPWLGLNETPISYPSHFRIDDALATAQVMGATVVRSHTLEISVGCSLCVEPKLGTFNSVALQHIDYVIQSAHIHHIKLIIPLTDNWHYYHGGKHTFTDWRHISDENQFYTNLSVVSDFKEYISVLLNHVNSYNGIAYKNDPTILAWETGNELSAPFKWVQGIANYIKSIDSHHLVMDGNDESDEQSYNFLNDLFIKNVDMYTGHYYPPAVNIFEKQVDQVIREHKVFIVGEYDWSADNITVFKKFLSLIESSKAAGDIYWVLFSHSDTYGYVKRATEQYILHFPGDTSNMQYRAALLRIHAYTMQGLSEPKTYTPEVPKILWVKGNAVIWRGAVGAYTYTVERSTQGKNGPWTVVCNRCITDTEVPWIDVSKPTRIEWYRVKGYTISGSVGPYSNVYSSS